VFLTINCLGLIEQLCEVYNRPGRVARCFGLCFEVIEILYLARCDSMHKITSMIEVDAKSEGGLWIVAKR
jgi:hypothetical protein